MGWAISWDMKIFSPLGCACFLERATTCVRLIFSHQKQDLDSRRHLLDFHMAPLNVFFIAVFFSLLVFFFMFLYVFVFVDNKSKTTVRLFLKYNIDRFHCYAVKK